MKPTLASPTPPDPRPSAAAAAGQGRPPRRLALLGVLLVALLVSACGASKTAQSAVGGVTSAAGAATSAAASAGGAATSAAGGATASASGQCAAAGSKSFAKTRFLADAGLAFGAFHRYVYKPLKSGGFSKGTAGRVKTFLKAGLAAAFVLNRLNAAKDNAQADPTLCKLVPDFSAAGASLSGLVAKLTGGGGAAALAQTNGAFSGLSSKLSSAGTSVADKVPAIPGVS